MGTAKELWFSHLKPVLIMWTTWPTFQYQCTVGQVDLSQRSGGYIFFTFVIWIRLSCRG